MTQNNNIRKRDAETVKKTAVKRPAAAKKSERDPYDEFLENAERAEKQSRKRAAAKDKEAPKSPAPQKGQRASTTDRKSPRSAGTVKKRNPQGDLLMEWEELEQDTVKTKGARKSASVPKSPAERKKKTGKRPTASNKKSRDEYDEFLEQAERSRPKRGRKSKALGTTIALLVLIGCMIGLAGWQYTRYQNFLVMKAAVDRTTFYEGITVEGVDVSGMTLEQAIDHWASGIEPGYSQRKVTLSNGAEFTAAELGYASDYAAVLTNAWGAGRSGSLVERYEALAFRKDQPASYHVTRTPYSAAVVEQCAAAVAKQIDRPAENSHIESFDVSSYQFRFTEEVIGSQLEQAQLVQDMTAALDAGGGAVELVVRSIQPQVKKEDIAGQYGMITSAVTNASSSSSNRLSNIKLAMKIINGTCLKPGETFSFNGVVGERTKARGFKVATAYASGKVVEDVGGGICQVSTTLFNAAVKADLKIVERHNHSLTVGYVDKGKDAAVDWGNQDLRFTNNTDDNIYICCYVTDNKRVRFGIFGKLLPNGETITVKGVTKGEVEFETVMQPNPALPSGQVVVTQAGKVGYKAEAYKIRWDADGNEISRELLCKSTYRATNEIIEYGP